MTYPDLPNRWTDADWEGLVDEIARFGFNVFEFWLVPRLFCREGLDGAYGREFVRQMSVVAGALHRRGMKMQCLCALATVGSDWRTLCPNVPDQWREIRHLWDGWMRALPFVDIVGIGSGDPGACSLNGCTALTFIDRTHDIAWLVKERLPAAEIEVATWGPPFFGWGIIEGPPGWNGEFVQEYQHSAWRFDAERARASMEHLSKRLPDFPRPTSVAINLGFNPDGEPKGDEDAREWARRIAQVVPVQTWDFSLTEGENAILPHYRFARLFEQRRRERAVGAYRGGICYTMTPRLNALSLYEASRSFTDPDADPDAVAREFYDRAFGPGAGVLAEDLVLFEIVKEWGNHVELDIARPEFHRRMARLHDRVAGWRGRLAGTMPLFPSTEYHRDELEFFSRWMRDVSGPAPDYDALRAEYWRRVYAIYDHLPRHVDPRPENATNNLVDFFRRWTGGAAERGGTSLGEWV